VQKTATAELPGCDSSHSARCSLNARLSEPFFLAKTNHDPIFKWKLRGQSGQNERHLGKNSDHAYKTITRAAFSSIEDDWKLEA
jgi:hypothetical protein